MEQLSLTLPFGVKAVLFDLDDTLYDRDAAYSAWAQTFVPLAFPAVDALRAQEIFAALIELDDHGYAAREALFVGLHQRCPELTLSLAACLEVYHQGLLQAIAPSPATTDFLEALTGAALPFGIITNGSARQRHKIELLGFDQLTSCIFISHLFGAKKPDPAIFLAAASRLQLPPGEILFVGDHPLNDVWGAHRSGMRTAWLRRATPWPETLPTAIADLTLDSLSELL